MDFFMQRPNSKHLSTSNFIRDGRKIVLEQKTGRREESIEAGIREQR